MLSFPHSLASNKLTGNETGYVKKSKVQGSSFEVGAKVTYEGREMTVSMAPDSDGDIKMYDLSGVMALAACLPECRSLTSLKCAAAAPADCSCQRPLTLLYTPLGGSLAVNQLCGLNKDGFGTYTAKGITALCEGLEGSSVTSLRCAAAWSVRLSVSAR